MRPVVGLVLDKRGAPCAFRARESGPFCTFSEKKMTTHRYRTHTCGALTAGDAGNNVRLSGWVHRIRDHGGLLFIDLRDNYGITQCVIDPDSVAFADAVKLRS